MYLFKVNDESSLKAKGDDFMFNACQKELSIVILLVFIISIISTSLTGCANTAKQSSSNEEKHIAIIISRTQNEGTIDINSLQDEIADLCMIAGSTVSYFNCDGDPEYVDTIEIPKYKKGISSSKKSQLANSYASQIATFMTEIVPTDEEMDLMKTITLASRQLQNYEGDKIMYITSSGLSTYGLVNFKELLLEKDHADELIKSIQSELPDMRGLKVVWSGMGETSGSQADLYESNRAILQNTWAKILIASGVNEEDLLFKNELSIKTDDQYEHLPYVSPVPISCNVKKIMGDCNNSAPEDKSSFVNLSDEVRFRPDSTQLLSSYDEVVDTLSEIIRYLKDNPQHRILLVGTTSSWTGDAGDEKSLQQFSFERCQRIKELLINEGVNERQIECVGAGFDNNLTANDRAEDGSLIEEIAEKNRCVYLFTDATSEAAQMIIKEFG